MARVPALRQLTCTAVMGEQHSQPISTRIHLPLNFSQRLLPWLTPAWPVRNVGASRSMPGLRVFLSISLALL